VMLVLAVGLSGCAEMSGTEKSTLIGGTGGAAGGAIIGAMAGNAGMGAAIGAGAGLVGGFLYGKHRNPSRTPTSKAISRANRAASPAANQSLSEVGRRHADEMSKAGAERSALDLLLASLGFRHLPPGGGKGHVKLCPLRRRSRGEGLGWGEKRGISTPPAFTPTLALPRRGGGKRLTGAGPEN